MTQLRSKSREMGYNQYYTFQVPVDDLPAAILDITDVLTLVCRAFFLCSISLGIRSLETMAGFCGKFEPFRTIWTFSLGGLLQARQPGSLQSHPEGEFSRGCLVPSLLTPFG